MAQAAPAQTLRGTVVNAATGTPIGGATIRMVHERGGQPRDAVSDSSGSFLVFLPASGLYTLTATRLGFVQHRGDTVRIGDSESVRVEIRLDRAALPLKPVVVTERISWLPDGFERRRATGFGRFLTRKDIEARQASNATEVLRGIPGIVLVPVRRGRGSGVNLMMRGTIGLCQPAMWIDGIQVSSFGDGVVDQLLNPSTLEAAEIYNSTSSAPTEYRTGSCGVVLFWTRRNAGPDRARVKWWKLVLGATVGVGLVLLVKR